MSGFDPLYVHLDQKWNALKFGPNWTKFGPFFWIFEFRKPWITKFPTISDKNHYEIIKIYQIWMNSIIVGPMYSGVLIGKTATENWVLHSKFDIFRPPSWKWGLFKVKFGTQKSQEMSFSKLHTTFQVYNFTSRPKKLILKKKKFVPSLEQCALG